MVFYNMFLKGKMPSKPFYDAVTATSNSFPKSLPDLANLFRLKKLIIWIYIIWHVILLIRNDGVLQRPYEGTSTLYLIFLDFCYFMIHL